MNNMESTHHTLPPNEKFNLIIRYLSAIVIAKQIFLYAVLEIYLGTVFLNREKECFLTGIDRKVISFLYCNYIETYP